MKTRIMIILAVVVIVTVLAAVVISRRGNEKNQNAADSALDEPETVEDFGEMSDEETNEKLIRLADEMEVVPDKE